MKGSFWSQGCPELRNIFYEPSVMVHAHDPTYGGGTEAGALNAPGHPGDGGASH